MHFFRLFYNYLLLTFSLLIISCSTSEIVNTQTNNGLDTVKSQRFDTGKMWTFEHAPLEYFEQEYNFKPSQEWLDKVRMSSLKFASWCSSSFVSEDGLIMTNHHCIDFITSRIEKEGEDIWKNGFIAQNLEDERNIPDIFVDQLVLIEDVTGKIYDSLKQSGGNINIEDIIHNLEYEYSTKTGLICLVTPLYNGGQFSLYGYRRYDDVRAVFFNPASVGLFGGDPDNFTYPRYDADFAFLRVYDTTGVPLKTDNYFKFQTNFPSNNEPIFTIGNPGTTERLNTVAQLEYKRDYLYKFYSGILGDLVKAHYGMMYEFPEKKDEILRQMNNFTNSAKVYSGIVTALNDPVLIAKKKDFEKNFKKKIFENSKLKKEFGYLWDAIKKNRDELRIISPELFAFNLNRYSPLSLTIAFKIASQIQSEEFSPEIIQTFLPEDFDEDMEKEILKVHLNKIIEFLGTDHPAVKKCFNGLSGDAAFEYVKAKSHLLKLTDIDTLSAFSKEEIINLQDPLILFAEQALEKLKNLMSKSNELNIEEAALEQEMGRALYEVYGASIPPDATFTLRLSDGVVKNYEYNGTIAPEYTTFYGMYDRYQSFKKQYPWDLPENWVNPPAEFDLNTPYNFISTNDITGGSSGSPVINKNGELIGIAFDGNIESLSGSFIYTSDSSRMVSVTSAAIIEIMSDLYKFKRIAEEIKTGKMYNSGNE